jgi:acetyl-CoA carboxylase biotin carboxylase subunit
VYVERYLPSARHVEIQVLFDQYGNGVHLGARDCSVQRRHQKLVEETPAPGLPDELVERRGRDALRGTGAAGFVGAGTVEFLVDPDGAYYFMEVNCRLQVEHPVTEMVTSIDIVAEQFRVAAGEKLDLTQDAVQARGVALECRINAEDPTRAFAPTPGVLVECHLPGGPFVRVDSHAFPGYRIPAMYDSLLAKVVVWAPDRDGALRRMRAALDELRLSGPGVATTVPFLRQVLDDPRFRSATHDTSLADALRSGRPERSANEQRS